MSDSVTPMPPPPPSPPSAPVAPAPAGKGCWYYGCLITAVLVLVIVATAAITAWQVKRSLRAPPIVPTELSAEEQQALDTKIEIFGRSAQSGDDPRELNPDPGQSLDPIDPDFVRKPLVITEREINALIASRTDLGEMVYVTLARNSLKLKVNYTFEEDVEYVGGKTFRINVRAHVALSDDQLDIRITDVALGGLPIPSAWLGGIKDVNLVEDFATNDEAMKTLVDGIESLDIEDGQIVFMPAE